MKENYLVCRSSKSKHFPISSRRVHFAKSLTDKVPSYAPSPASSCPSFLPFFSPSFLSSFLHSLLPFYLFVHKSLAAAAAKSLQSCLTLCNPIDGSLPGSAIPGILQARTPELVAISFFNAWKWKVKVKSLSRVRLLETPWTAAYQAPPSMGFSKQEYWSGVPLPSPAQVPYSLPNSPPYICSRLSHIQMKQNTALFQILKLKQHMSKSMCMTFSLWGGNPESQATRIFSFPRWCQVVFQCCFNSCTPTSSTSSCFSWFGPNKMILFNLLVCANLVGT